MTNIFNTHSMKSRRRELRHSSPKAERILWAQLRQSKICGQRFRRQYSIGGYVVDFYCPKRRLAIEIDGPYHFQGRETEEYDRDRQRKIERFSITLIRFTNTCVYEDMDGVLLAISRSLK